MKRKLERLSAEMAFGELEKAEALRLQAVASEDPEVAQAVSSYTELRENLKARAASCPEPAMSTERLRQALLADGLSRPQGRSFGLAWAWMPAAAFVLAFAFFSFRNGLVRGSAHDVALVGGGKVYAVRDSVQGPPLEPLPWNEQLVPVPDTTAPSLTTVAKGPGPIHVHRAPKDRSSAPTIVASGATGGSVMEAIVKMTKPDLASSGPMASLGAPPQPAGGASSDSGAALILIQADTDGQTGAQRATEVESVANVSIGG